MSAIEKLFDQTREKAGELLGMVATHSSDESALKNAFKDLESLWNSSEFHDYRLKFLPALQISGNDSLANGAYDFVRRMGAIRESFYGNRVDLDLHLGALRTELELYHPKSVDQVFVQ